MAMHLLIVWSKCFPVQRRKMRGGSRKTKFSWLFKIFKMMNHLQTYFDTWYVYFTDVPYPFHNFRGYIFENMVFVIMSTSENVHHIARSPLLNEMNKRDQMQSK